MENTFYYLLSSELHQKLLPLKVLFLFASALLFFGIVYLLKISDWLKYHRGFDIKEFKDFKAKEATDFVKRWQKTKLRLTKNWESEAKLAIIEADALLDELLQRSGYPGENLEERLEQIDENVLANIKDVFQAHQICEEIVKSPDYKIDLKKAKQIIEIYDQTFQNLGAL